MGLFRSYIQGYLSDHRSETDMMIMVRQLDLHQGVPLELYMLQTQLCGQVRRNCSGYF